MSALASLMWRDLRLALRQSGDVLLAVLFFILGAALFPFAVGPEPNLLLRLGPGLIWVMALLSVLLSLDRLFAPDHEDGTLDLLLLAPVPLEGIVLARILAHWLASGGPLILATPLLAIFFGVPAHALPVLLGSLLLGTLALSALGALGAALTLGARRAGVLVPLLVLPLYIPVLIFGAGAVDAVLTGLAARPHLLLLAAVLLLSLPLAALAGAAALRQAAE
ncbi:heme exporter protein CcmB [Fodinicurvata sediminis]|uniref:heme exporter protein CcmB n=1 Tax=Fodinicurvata sediminis TaxID=1121832 RepID=UPI0003B79D5C|nr:heme exporter protein CcmB [Fodinicurvata sediminis]